MSVGSWETPEFDGVVYSPNSIVTLQFTAGSDASIPDLELTEALRSQLKYQYLFQVETQPGGDGGADTKPTDGWSLTLEDADGDILGGACLSRTQSRQIVRPIVGGISDTFIYRGQELTIKISSNSVASAVGIIRLYLTR